MTDIYCALQDARALLAPTSPSAAIDADILLAHTLGVTRTFLYTHPEKTLDSQQLDTFQELVTKRCKGTPIAYLIHSREFWSLPLQVSEDTLIPRPETELLVELTLTLLKEKSTAYVLDLGTGSGAIALALASERPDWHLLASDSSERALETARQNAERLGLSNVRTIHSDWFASLHEPPFDAIVSNPPYIAEQDPHLTEGDVRFEPQQALVSGIDGLVALTHIIQHSYDRLLPGGFLLLEHGFMQKKAVCQLLDQHGFEQIQCWQDHQGHDRVSGGKRKAMISTF